MVLMFNIFGRIKDGIIATLLLAIPIIYVFGRAKGKAAEKHKVLKDELQAQNKATDFYKAMAEHEEDGTIDSRSNLSDRLRRNGL